MCEFDRTYHEQDLFGTTLPLGLVTSNRSVLSTQFPTGAEVGLETGLDVVGGVVGVTGARVGEATGEATGADVTQVPHVTGQASFVPPHLLHRFHVSFLATLHHFEHTHMSPYTYCP